MPIAGNRHSGMFGAMGSIRGLCATAIASDFVKVPSSANVRNWGALGRSRMSRVQRPSVVIRRPTSFPSAFRNGAGPVLNRVSCWNIRRGLKQIAASVSLTRDDQLVVGNFFERVHLVVLHDIIYDGYRAAVPHDGYGRKWALTARLLCIARRSECPIAHGPPERGPINTK